MAIGSRARSGRSKAEQARATRRRVIEAATRLFVRDGFLSTTMAAIAAEAGVAVQTLYLAFGNKTAILSAAFDVALAGDDEPIPVPRRDWMREARENPDGVAGLATFLAGSAAVIERVSPLYGVIRAAAADPEVAELLTRNKRERHDAFSGVADSLARRTGFNPGLTPADATGVLYAVSSEESFALLVDEHGWTPRQWADWVQRTVRPQFFPAAG